MWAAGPAVGEPAQAADGPVHTWGRRWRARYLEGQRPAIATAESAKQRQPDAAEWPDTSGDCKRETVKRMPPYRAAGMRGLTFELSGRRRQDARPGLAKMYRVPPDRAWWPAVGAPLERGVRLQQGERCTDLNVLA